MSYDFGPPRSTPLGDHDVNMLGHLLQGRRVALLVCGGIAAMKAPLTARALRKHGAKVTAFVSQEALRYVTRDALEWSTTNPVVERLSAQAEHLSDDAPFDAYLLAPATYNTINKLATGIADGVLTSTLASALGRMERGRCAILVAPTMHGSMHNRILTDSLTRLDAMGVRVIPPRDAYGKDNIPAEEVLVAEVCRAVSRSPLLGQKILVTGGPTPVPVDGVRRLTNRFTGRLGVAIATELHLRGADVRLIHGGSPGLVPDWLPHRRARTLGEYQAHVHGSLAQGGYRAGVFSAAVADYAPTAQEGKTPSGKSEWLLRLTPTPKVIKEVRSQFQDLHMVTFKYQEGVTHEQLIAIAENRLRTYDCVVANRGEETAKGGPQVAWLVTGQAEPRRLEGKPGIARAIADYLEGALSPD